MSDQTARTRRVTIRDIADRAGVSKGAVSYALNGRPGVSDRTRERIVSIAQELGWYPNRAARALSAERAEACGLVLARPAKTLALEPFFMEFIAGVESEVSARSFALTIQLAENVQEEIEIYRRWWGERRVDGVLIIDLRVDDPRVEALEKLGLPAVVVGGPVPGGALPSVSHDEASVVFDAVRYLAALGHTRIGRVAGVGHFVHTTQRTEAFRSVAHELGLRARSSKPTTRPRAGHGRHVGSFRPLSRLRRSSTTATCWRSPGWGSRSTWVSPSPMTSRSWAGTTR